MMGPSKQFAHWNNYEIYRHATPYWEIVTGKGSSSATTTFEHEYNKNDFRYVELDAKKRRYTGDRAMALGYMQNGVKMVKFLRSETGRKLVEVDCTKPNRFGDSSQNRIRQVQDDFVTLCSRYSKGYQEQAGDFHAVKLDRGFEEGKFALRWGFGFAIISTEFAELKRKWLADEAAEAAEAAKVKQVANVAPVLPATPLAVVVGVELPKADQPRAVQAHVEHAVPDPPPRSPSLVDMDESSDEFETDGVLKATKATELTGEPLELAPNEKSGGNSAEAPETIPTVVPEPAVLEYSSAFENKSDRRRELHQQIFGEIYDDDVGTANVASDDDRGLSHGLEQARNPEEEVAVSTPVPQAEIGEQREFAGGVAAMATEDCQSGKRKKQPAPPVVKPAPATIKPAQGPRKKQAPSPVAEPECALVGVDMRALGTEILNAFGEAKKAHKTNVYQGISAITNTDKPLYSIVTKRRKDGVSAGAQDSEVYIKPPLSKAIGKSRLRSNPNIKAAFRLA
jgi:hypothetical protein